MADQAPWDRLFDDAAAVRERAYAPYSHFKVGAAALFDDGVVVTGCNVENASYGLSVCAERNAVGRAVGEGHKKLKAIAIVADSQNPVPPCGMCRQVLSEFATPETPVRLRNLQGKEAHFTIKELLPYAFTPDFL